MVDKPGEILLSNRNGGYCIQVSGRATFECAPPLRNLAKTLETESFNKIVIELGECTWMDSTFMGILAMLGLRAKRIGAEMIVNNASAQNIDLLCGLGLKKLFVFTSETSDATACPDGTTWLSSDADPGKPSAQTVLDAHKTLMSVDAGNVQKFGAVVDMVQKDLDKMNDSDKDD